jgi:hypothetical protein
MMNLMFGLREMVPLRIRLVQARVVSKKLPSRP